MVSCIPIKDLCYARLDSALLYFKGHTLPRVPPRCHVCRYRLDRSLYVSTDEVFCLYHTEVLPLDGNYYIVPLHHTECRSMFNLNPLAYKVPGTNE